MSLGIIIGIRIYKKSLQNCSTNTKSASQEPKIKLKRKNKQKKLNEEKIEKSYFYWNHDKKYWDSYIDLFSSENFSKIYISYLKNMDKDSQLRLARVINRIKKAYNMPKNEKIDFFDKKEQENQRYFFEYFPQEIVELSDDLFCYQDFLLPVNNFEIED